MRVAGRGRRRDDVVDRAGRYAGVGGSAALRPRGAVGRRAARPSGRRGRRRRSRTTACVRDVRGGRGWIVVSVPGGRTQRRARGPGRARVMVGSIAVRGLACLCRPRGGGGRRHERRPTRRPPGRPHGRGAQPPLAMGGREWVVRPGGFAGTGELHDSGRRGAHMAEGAVRKGEDRRKGACVDRDLQSGDRGERHDEERGCDRRELPHAASSRRPAIITPPIHGPAFPPLCCRLAGSAG